MASHEKEGFQIGIIGSGVTWRKAPAREQSKEERIKIGRIKPCRDEWTRRTWRRRKALMRLFGSIQSKAAGFVSLVFPYEQAHDMTPGALSAAIIRLRDYLRYHCPNSWFVYVYEWSKDAGFHIHLLGTLDHPKGIKAHQFFASTWSAIVNDDNGQLVMVSKRLSSEGVRARQGYLTSRYKFHDQRRLIEEFGWKHSFGIIHKKNIIFKHKERYAVDAETLKQIRECLLVDLNKCKHGKRKKEHANQIRYSNSGYHIINSKQTTRQLYFILSSKGCCDG